MTRHLLRAATAALSLLALAASATAHEYKAGALEIVHPWSRATPPTASAGGGYMTIKNSGTTPDRLLSAAATVSRTVELHETTMSDGVMRMRAVSGFDIPPGGALVLAPGAGHVMFLGLTSPLVEGARFPLTLTFAKAGKVVVDIKVEKAGAAPMDHHGHGDATPHKKTP